MNQQKRRERMLRRRTANPLAYEQHQLRCGLHGMHLRTTVQPKVAVLPRPAAEHTVIQAHNHLATVLGMTAAMAGGRR